MIEQEQGIRDTRSKVFVSYSSSDRARVTGLGLLLEALGHEVFLDHKTIKPGARWEPTLQDGLLEADVLVVFWTKRAARAEWVRKEYEYFHAHFPERLLVPVLGDETALSELLKARQHSDFAPLINELLELKRQMTRDGVDAKGIQQAILKRLAEAGIEFDEHERNKLFGFIGAGAIAGLGAVTAAVGFLRWAGRTATEAAAQLSGAQVVLVAAGVVSGGVVCEVTDRALQETSETVPVVADAGPKSGGEVSVESVAGAPDLTRVWNSTYGDIHLTRDGNTYEGWYGNTNKILNGTLSEQEGTWIFVGKWGRKNDPDYKGGVRFLFPNPTAFTGTWWHDSSPLSTVPWTGSLSDQGNRTAPRPK